MDIYTNKNLNNGVEIPVLGLGVFRTNGEETINAVKRAIQVGYRHIDTAQGYDNELEVGIGVKQSGEKRENIFITTKVSTDNIRSGRTKQSVEESLTRLGTDYIDLLLLHWPVEGTLAAWKTLENIYKQGKVRAIGISNFHKHHLEKLMKVVDVVPAVNQIEMHPHLTQSELRKTINNLGIIGQSWSPIGGIKGNSKQETVISEIAAKYSKTPVQVILRWHIQHGMVVIPKSSNNDRITENSNIFDFNLTQQEMTLIDDLNKNERVGSDPNSFDF